MSQFNKITSVILLLKGGRDERTPLLLNVHFKIKLLVYIKISKSDCYPHQIKGKKNVSEVDFFS